MLPETTKPKVKPKVKPEKVRRLVVAKTAFKPSVKKGAPRAKVYGSHPDDAVWDDDPIVKKYPDMFEPVEDVVARLRGTVHVATAVPGEKR